MLPCSSFNVKTEPCDPLSLYSSEDSEPVSQPVRSKSVSDEILPAALFNGKSEEIPTPKDEFSLIHAWHICIKDESATAVPSKEGLLHTIRVEILQNLNIYAAFMYPVTCFSSCVADPSLLSVFLSASRIQYIVFI